MGRHTARSEGEDHTGPPAPRHASAAGSGCSPGAATIEIRAEHRVGMQEGIKVRE